MDITVWVQRYWIDMSLAEELAHESNSKILDSLVNFVMRNRYHDEEPFMQLRKLVNKYHPPTETKILYRGTKVHSDKIPHVVSGKPFTLEGDRSIRSWTTRKDIAERFATKYLYSDALGMVVTREYPPNTIIIDMTDDRILDELEKLTELLKATPKYSLVKFFSLVVSEKEVIVMITNYPYTLCDDILTLVINPSGLDNEKYDAIANMLSPTEKNALEYDRYKALATFRCQGGKLIY